MYRFFFHVFVLCSFFFVFLFLPFWLGLPFSLSGGAWPSPTPLFWLGLAFPILFFSVGAWPSPLPLLGLAFPLLPFGASLSFPFGSRLALPFPFVRAWPSHSPSKAGPGLPLLPFLARPGLLHPCPLGRGLTFPFASFGPGLPLLPFGQALAFPFLSF